MPGDRDERLRAWAGEAAARLARIGEALAARQISSGAAQGNVPPWPGADDQDFHGTLAAVWIWARAQKLTGEDRFAVNIGSAWSFVANAWKRFIPSALGASATDEAPYDCAMLLRAAALDRSQASEDLRGQIESAARLLGVYLSDLDDLGGREFRDPGFLAWCLADYARETGDRGLLASARRFVDRAFGMKAPPAFSAEPAATDGLFDFSSTTSTRIHAVLAGEGATPFVGAWLRERVGASAPRELVSRPMDENAWNACVAAALGRAYVVATDTVFFDGHQAIIAELDRRAEGAAISRHPGLPIETLATFYYALAVDSLVKL
jgi:hypothetical protein